MTPQNNRLSQPRLALEVRRLTDQAMVVRPVHGPNQNAMRQLRRLLSDYPEILTASHVRHNLGKRRLDWLAQVKERWV